MKKHFKHAKFSATFTDEGGYFSLTGECEGGSGAVGERIAEIDPQFAPLALVHVCDAETGEPLHAWANAAYWAERGDIATLARHLHCDETKAAEYASAVSELARNTATKERITPYRKHTCSFPYWWKAGDVLRDKEEAERRYRECHHVWVSPVELSWDTHNINGEKTVLCPKCQRRPAESSPYCDKDGSPWDTATMDMLVVPASREAIYAACEKWAGKVAELQGELSEQWRQEAEAAREAAEDIPANLTRGFVDPYTADGEFISQEHEYCLNLFDEPEKAIAAAMEEGVDVCDVTEKGEYYTAAGREYRVLTDDEADAAEREYLLSIIDDVLEIPDSIRPYFDEEAWLKDARQDGRGHHLAGYDGVEREQEVEGTRYFLYRC